MAFEVVVEQADRKRALCFDVLPDDEIDRAVFDHFDIALGDVVNDDVQLFAAVCGVHGAVNALPSRRGQIDAAQLAVRLNGAHSDALGKALVEERAFRVQNPDIREALRHFGAEAGETLRVGIVTAALTQNRQHAAVPLHDHAEQRGGGAAGRDVVRADVGDAVRVGDVRIERHDRDALLFAERVDLVAHERIRERHERETVDVLGRYQLIDQRQLMLHIHVLHCTHDDRNVRDKRTLGKALEQLAQHLHEGRMAGVEHHADLPLLRLLHDEAVGDITHFTRRRTDALRDLLTHTLLVVQGAVHRSTRHPAAVSNLLHRYHKITLLRSLYLYYIIKHSRAPDVTSARKCCAAHHLQYNDSAIFVHNIINIRSINIHIHDIMHG